MKKLRRLLLVLVLMMIVSEITPVHASEMGMEVIAHEVEIRELSQAETDMLSMETIIGEADLPLSTTASYTAYEYAQTFDFVLEGTWVAQADARCVVWHYTDGKVHLYQRTITVRRLSTYDATRTYGRIVNTDGSLSYTTGDRVCIISYDDYWDFAIDFRVTPTEASFDCYEV